MGANLRIFEGAYLPDCEAPGGLPRPAEALPGTPAKVAVMCERARKRQSLFHPLDGNFLDALIRDGYRDRHGNPRITGVTDDEPALRLSIDRSEQTGFGRRRKK